MIRPCVIPLDRRRRERRASQYDRSSATTTSATKTTTYTAIEVSSQITHYKDELMQSVLKQPACPGRCGWWMFAKDISFANGILRYTAFCPKCRIATRRFVELEAAREIVGRSQRSASDASSPSLVWAKPFTVPRTICQQHRCMNPMMVTQMLFDEDSMSLILVEVCISCAQTHTRSQAILVNSDACCAPESYKVPIAVGSR